MAALATAAMITWITTMSAMAQPNTTQTSSPTSKVPQRHGPPPLHSVKDKIQYVDKAPGGFSVQTYPTNVVETKYTELVGRNTTEPTRTAVTKTKDSPETVFNWYEQSLRSSGWTIQQAKQPETPNKMEQKGRLFMLQAQKDTSMLFLFCARTRKEPYTVANLSIVSKSHQ